MKTFFALLVIAQLSLFAPANARTIEDVNLPEQITLANTALQLNGAGIRTKFVFNIYVGTLYLPQKASAAKQILAMNGAKRVGMHILYSEIDKEKLINGWHEGFENNLDNKQFEALKPRLQQFNNLFVTVKKGDVIYLDFIPGKGTVVTINNKTRGTVQGDDFYTALLKVWLGEEPADDDLKAAMLGTDNE